MPQPSFGWFGVVFLVLNISNADCLFEIHSIIGKECLFVRQVHLGCSGQSKSMCIQQFITLAYTFLSLGLSEGIAKKVVCNFIFKYLLVHSCGPSALSS